jgi:hypothetical protein
MQGVCDWQVRCGHVTTAGVDSAVRFLGLYCVVVFEMLFAGLSVACLWGVNPCCCRPRLLRSVQQLTQDRLVTSSTCFRVDGYSSNHLHCVVLAQLHGRVDRVFGTHMCVVPSVCRVGGTVQRVHGCEPQALFVLSASAAYCILSRCGWRVCSFVRVELLRQLLALTFAAGSLPHSHSWLCITCWSCMTAVCMDFIMRQGEGVLA